jgi:hypothetical protein
VLDRRVYAMCALHSRTAPWEIFARHAPTEPLREKNPDEGCYVSLAHTGFNLVRVQFNLGKEHGAKDIFLVYGPRKIHPPFSIPYQPSDSR